MKLVFLGTSELAACALKAIHLSTHNVTLVATQPDRGAGRGRRTMPPPVKVMAEELELPVVQPERVNTRAFRALVREHEPDVIVVTAFGQIIRPLLLALPPRGCLNVHASILPRHRGASPIQAAILAGDEEVGVSIMKLDEGMDTGPVGLVGRLAAREEETAGELHDRLAALGAELIVEALDALEQDCLDFQPQDSEEATYAPKLTKEDGRINLHQGAELVWRQVRAMTPRPGCFGDLETDRGDARVILGRCRTAAGMGQAGEILEVSDEGLLVACSSGALQIFELKPAGKKMMTVKAFLNGRGIAPGSRFKGVSGDR